MELTALISASSSRIRLRFVDELRIYDTVEVVPELWYRKEGSCAWPKTSNIKDIKKAVILKTRPNKHDFSYYEARCLASNIDNFQKAQKKCNIAKCKSDLSSMEDDKLKKKRTIIRKYKTYSSSESDGEKSDTHMNKNAIPCYHSDSEPQHKKKNQIQNKTISQTVGIERRPNGWSPLKTSITDITEKEETIHMGNTKTISDLKLSADETTLFSEKKSPYNQSLSDINLPRSSPSNRVKRCLFSDTDKNNYLNFNSAGVNNNSPKVSSVKGSGKRSLFSDFYEHLHPNSKSPDLINDSTTNILSVKSLEKISLHTDVHNGSNSITPNFNDTSKASVKKNADRKSSTNSNSTILKKDDRFKDMVLHSLIILKHSIRNLDEKMDLLIEKTSRSSENTNINDDDIIDYTNLNCLFPIGDMSTLNDIEEQLVSDKKYHKSLTNKLIRLGGKTVQIYIKRVMQLLFSDELLKLYSFNGRGNKKNVFLA
ncbi:metacaspase-2-like [Aphis gossypii]|uniref:metacaspase-2-like n=1 Tax=Aphis gossypii TaxID=80765 RepID=UPI002158B6C4|nr:metacaspase-2-like [Aphis gossypii]